MAFGIELRADPLRSLAAASITSSYVAVGTLLQYPARILKIDNLTDATVLFSFDGITDHFILPTNGFFVIDVTSNQIPAQGFYLSSETVIYAKRSGTPTTGSVYATVLRARNV